MAVPVSVTSTESHLVLLDTSKLLEASISVDETTTERIQPERPATDPTFADYSTTQHHSEWTSGFPTSAEKEPTTSATIRTTPAMANDAPTVATANQTPSTADRSTTTTITSETTSNHGSDSPATTTWTSDDPMS